MILAIKERHLTQNEVAVYIHVAFNEVRKGAKVRINRFVPFISIFTSRGLDIFIEGKEARQILEDAPINISPEVFCLVQAVSTEIQKIANKKNERFKGTHTNNKTLPLNQADIDQKKNLDGFSLTSPKNERGKQ